MDMMGREKEKENGNGKEQMDEKWRKRRKR